MTTPVEDDFATPVELDGVDSTRVWRGRARQTLTLSPDGVRWVRDGKTVTLAWRDIRSIELVNMVPPGFRSPTFNAWAISGNDVGPIYPHEFDKQWTTGTIGRWVAHYRPDLELPASGGMQPFGIPREQYRWAIPFAVVAGFVGSFAAAKSVGGALGVMAVMVLLVLPFTSLRRYRIAGYVVGAVFLAWLLVLGYFWLTGM